VRLHHPGGCADEREEGGEQAEEPAPVDTAAIAPGNHRVADHSGRDEDQPSEPGLVGLEIAEGVRGGIDAAPEDQMRRRALIAAQRGAAPSGFVSLSVKNPSIRAVCRVSMFDTNRKCLNVFTL
jgi:hypothetical protein